LPALNATTIGRKDLWHQTSVILKLPTGILLTVHSGIIQALNQEGTVKKSVAKCPTFIEKKCIYQLVGKGEVFSKILIAHQSQVAFIKKKNKTFDPSYKTANTVELEL